MRYTMRVIAMLAAFAGSSSASQVLLDTGVGSFLTFRTIDAPGQGVYVGADTELNQIGFYMSAPLGADIKFMIWNGDNTELLFSQVQSLKFSRVTQLVLSNPFSFELQEGYTYYFSVIADNAEDVSAFYPVVETTQNQLTLVNPNSNYGDYDHPYFINYSSATVALQLVGTTVPEPGSVSLPIAAAVSIFGLRRVRRPSAG